MRKKKEGYVKIVEESGDEVELTVEPARYVSASPGSEYESRLKTSLSSLYSKVSEWSLPPRNRNLFTVNEREHDFLMDRYEEEPPDDDLNGEEGSLSSSSRSADDFGDVVDRVV